MLRLVVSLTACSRSSASFPVQSVSFAGGCSLTDWVGRTHDTAGSVPFFAAATKLSTDCTLPTVPACCTSVKLGSGFQMEPVRYDCGSGMQLFEPSGQSGSVPSKT